ncbi:hypothetical protein [Acanthopleuribacter pedis]|uniref:Uncharacterized protein n=1 Tax=Acanthopleuribacter pedis TaxID=442870 RepID=A0A8J7U668_9BACT|nr:hypothetical protein [Acanthopleuribacter pedis]MBO1322472.1 hypothetical protein [Acanthopleuribacter pedis]
MAEQRLSEQNANFQWETFNDAVLHEVELDWFAGDARIKVETTGEDHREITIVGHGFMHTALSRTFPKGRSEAIASIDVHEHPEQADLWVMNLVIQSGDALVIHARIFDVDEETKSFWDL